MGFEMKNSAPMIGLLVVLLLVGIGIGGWLLMTDDTGVTATGSSDSIAHGNDDDVERVNMPEGNTADDNTAGGGNGGSNTGDNSAGNGNTGGGNGTTDPADPDSAPDPEPKIDFTEKFYQITGKVIYDETKQPATGVEVVVAKSESRYGYVETDRDGEPLVKARNNPIQYSGKAVTDGGGEFTMDVTIRFKTPKEESYRLPNFTVQVVAKQPGFAPARSKPVVLAKKPPHVELSLHLPVAVSGVVLDAATQEPIEDASVTLQREFGPAGYADHRILTTDALGKFSANDIARGHYYLTIRAEGYGDKSDAKQVALTSASVDLGEFYLTPSATVRLRVVDPSGNPLAGASVKFGRMMDNFDSYMVTNFVATKEDGVAESQIESGRIKIDITHDYYAAYSQAGIVLTPGESKDLGDIALSKGFTLSGTVKSKDGKAVESASLTVQLPGEKSPFFRTEGEPIGKTASGSSGEFELRNLPSTEIVLRVVHKDFAMFEKTLTLTKNTQLDIVLSLGATVTGRVLNSDGTPATKISVVMISERSPTYMMLKFSASSFSPEFAGERDAKTETKDDGTFSLSGLAEDKYCLFIGRGDADWIRKDSIEITGEKSKDLGEFKFKAAGTLIVRLVKNGTPVVNTKVRLSPNRFRNPGSEIEGDGLTDSSGDVTFSDVRAQVWYVMVGDENNAGEGTFSDRVVEVVAGETTRVTIDLSAPERAILEGRLTVNGEGVLTHINLEAVGRTSTDFVQAKIEEGGMFRVEGVSLGDWILHASVGQQNLPFSIPVKVDKPGRMEINRDFLARRVGGVVKTPGDSLLERNGTSLQIRRVGGQESQFSMWMVGETKVKPDGSFIFPHVPVGNYVVRAHLKDVGTVEERVDLTAGDRLNLVLEIVKNSTRLIIKIKETVGTPVDPSVFGIVQVHDAQGDTVAIPNPTSSLVTPAKDSENKIEGLAPGVYTIRVIVAGYQVVEIANVELVANEETRREVVLTASAELRLTFNNALITKELLNDSSKTSWKAYDTNGTEIKIETFDVGAFSGDPKVFAKPTLQIRFLSPEVTEIRVKIDGWHEVIVPVDAQPGRLIETEAEIIPE